MEQAALSTLEEFLFAARIARAGAGADAEADVHPAAHGSMRDDVKYGRVGVKDGVDGVGFGISEGGLAGEFAGAVGVEQGVDHLAGDPDAEDGHGVVERGVFSNGGPVQDGRRRPDAERVEKGWWRVGGEEVGADDDEGDVGDADVFLGAALFFFG